MKEDYSPIGKFISVCLVALLLLQAYWLFTFLANPENPARYEILAGIGYTSLFSIIFWLPGIILGYLILNKLRNKAVGIFTISISAVQSGIFLWALTN
jgi:hypothetical protein